MAAEREDERKGLIALAILASILGAAAGLLGAVFRLSLSAADRFRDSFLACAHGIELGGLLLAVGLSAVATGLASWLVTRFAPPAKGSGIPHVEAVLRGDQPPAPLRLLPVKFFGGLLSMGAGLALGREGPSVQMGASLAHLGATFFRRNVNDCRALLAAGAGAGLATAFNAPIAGAVFVLEELVRKFDTRTTIATLSASGSAIAVARIFLGELPDFQIEAPPYPGWSAFPVSLVLGLVLGLLGIAYNHAILGASAAGERLCPPVARAAIVGTGVGILAWYAPHLVGGGDALTQRVLAGSETLIGVGWVFLLRFALGPISYAAGTPGGIFAPLLVIGAQSGFLFGALCGHWFPEVGAPSAMAVVGMAAFFTAVVRAPLTGIVLIIEMTASFTLLLPMLVACFAAMLVTTWLGNEPIYDSLRQPPSRKETTEH